MFPLLKPPVPLYVQEPGPDVAALLPSEHADRSHILALIRLGDYSQDAFLATDTYGAIVYMNRSAERLFGYRNGAAIGLSVEALLPDVGDINHRLRQPGTRNTLATAFSRDASTSV